MYRISLLEKLKCIITDLVIIYVMSYLFYESVVAFLAMIPFVYILYRRQKRGILTKRKIRINNEFKELCTSISSNLSAGYSLENSIKYAASEIVEMYGKSSVLIDDLNIVISKISLNTSVEAAFMQMAEALQIEEITIFAEIIALAKRSSGNIIQIVKNTAESIGSRIEQKRQIELVFASKRYEQKIMNIIPMFIIVYVKVTSPGMLDIMYQTLIGRVVMSICLAMYIGAFALSERIMEIDI